MNLRALIPWKKREAVPAVKAGPKSRGFQAAMFGRLVSDWMASSATLDSDLRGSIRTVRNRARDLAQNNDHVRSFLREVETNVIGRGVGFQPQVRDSSGNLNKKVNDDITREWFRWTKANSCHVAGTHSFTMIERLSARTMAGDGEIYVRLVRKRFGQSRVPLSLQLLEGDMLDESMNGVIGENIVRMGVELNTWGRPVAYHFLKNHPGDNAFPQKIHDAERVRVPAEDIIPLFVPERVIQNRGFPWIVSAMFKLHQLKGYEDASVVRKRALAAIMGFIETPAGSDGVDSDYLEEDELQFFAEPGVYRRLHRGEEVKSANPGPGSEAEFEPFTSAMLRSVCAGIGASYENITKDYSKSNYSSSRLALSSERGMWRIVQDFMIERFHQRVYEEFLSMAVLAGVLQLDDFYKDSLRYSEAVRWMPRGWEYVDPLKEITANAEACNAGFKTISDVLAQDGKDFEETMTQIKREQDFIRGLGINLSSVNLEKLSSAGGQDVEKN